MQEKYIKITNASQLAKQMCLIFWWHSDGCLNGLGSLCQHWHSVSTFSSSRLHRELCVHAHAKNLRGCASQQELTSSVARCSSLLSTTKLAKSWPSYLKAFFQLLTQPGKNPLGGKSQGYECSHSLLQSIYRQNKEAYRQINLLHFNSQDYGTKDIMVPYYSLPLK